MNGETTARQENLVGCLRCSCVAPIETKTCEKCGAKLVSRKTASLYWVWLWWCFGVLAYIPANIWPMLQTRMLLTESEDTIIEGAWKLADHGSYAVAAIIILASVIIPIGKFLAVAVLALMVHLRAHGSAKWRHRIYEAVEFIGRWSMVDVFVVAILSSLVQFSLIATVQPGLAAFAFAMSVIFTMLSAKSFDPRMIWDLDRAGPSPTGP